MAAVSLYLQQIGIRLVSAILLYFLAVHVYWRLSGFFEILLPEVIEVLRILRIWFQLFRREPHLHVVFVRLVVDSGLKPQVQESRLLHRSHIDGGPSVLQFHLSVAGGWHLVRTDFITDLYILWNTILTEGDFHLSFLSDLVEPVGMIGHSQP